MLGDLYQLISDAENRELLGWIGGALAVIFSGIWVVLRYYFDNKKPPSSEERNQEESQSKSISHGSINIEGNVKKSKVTIEKD